MKTSQPTYHPTLDWECSRCQAQGQIDHKADADCLQVQELVFADHRKVSPQCVCTSAIYTRSNGPLSIPG